MKLDYHLTFDHFLEHQLYAASHSKSAQKKRRNSRIIMAAAYAFLGLFILSLTEDDVLGGVFIAIGIGWYFAYPFYSRQRYRRHYQKYIRENYQSRINVPLELEVEPDFILSKDKSGESKVIMKEVEALVSLPNIFLIKMKSGVSFIVPKDSVLNQELWLETFQNIGIELVDETEWKWK